MRRFVLDRTEDPSHVSGTGLVAEGFEFADGHVVLRWVPAPQSTGFYDSLEDVQTIHCHGGTTRVVFVDVDVA